MANEFRVRKKLIVNGSGSTILDVQGSQGQLFSITDSLSGSLFSVKDISGIPVMEAFSDDTVNIGTFNAEAIKVSGSFARITGSLFGTASWSNNAVSSSYAATASYALNAGGAASAFPYTGSARITGSLNVIGPTTITGSFNVSGSTTQIGNNTLLGTTLLSGSLTISGSQGPGSITASVQIFGDIRQSGYHRFDPTTTNIDTSVSASYIYVSGSTNDLYFSQNGSGFSNVTRLRWLEGNLYTGLLNGGFITTQSSTVYQISSGSGIVVNLNASIANNPYPIITYVNWSNLSSSIAPLSASFDQSFVAVLSNGTIGAQGTPYENGDYNAKIPIGVIVHQNRSTINAVQTFPGVAYGWKQRSYDFIRAFGPLKISGYILSPSGSSTGSLVLSGGTAWVDGRNYIVDPNEPSYITEAVGIATSKIYRYYQSGSDWKYDTNAGIGYPTIDPSKYSNNGVLTPVSSNNWSIQRVFYFPNSGTKAFYIYYGNAQYANEAAALAAVGTEPFTEAPNTAANALYIGYILVRNDANFTIPASYTIYEAGLFRGGGSGGAGGGGGATTLASLTDVSISSPTDYQPFAYNAITTKWENRSTISASLAGNANTATSASYAQTASAASNFVVGNSLTASNALITGTITAQTLVVQTITSSTDFVTGSTKFGSLLTNTHQFTGSVSVTGSLAVNNSIILTGSISISGSSPLIQLGSTSNVGDLTNPTITIGSTSNGIYLDTNRVFFKAGGSFAGGFSSDGILANQILIRSTGPNDLTTAMYIPYRLNAIGLSSGLGGNDTGAVTLITSGSARLYVSSSGNVGIGTTTPSASLQINTTNVNGIKIRSANSGYLEISELDTKIWRLASNYNRASLFEILANDMNGGSSFSSLFSISGSGNVGIATTTPSYSLDINGTFRVTGLGYSTGYSFSAQRLQFNSGNVGSNLGYIIGTSNGVFRFVNAAESDFTRLQFGGTTSAFPGIQRVNTSLAIVGADGSTTSSLLIGQTTDDTFNRLQVSGSTRISQALTASQALISGSGTQRLVVVGSGSAQPIFTVQGSQGELFSIVDSLSGSLFSVNDQSGLPIMEVFSDSTILMGNYLDPMLLTTTRTGSAAGINTIYSLPTASYDAIYIDYTIRSGSNARAGNFMAMWSGTSVNFTDTSITEFGSTLAFTFGAHVSGANMVVTGSAPTSGWTIKTILKAI